MVLALATFATTGLKTSRVTTDLTEANAAASAGANWAIEELAKKQIAPENTVDCDATPVDLGAPAGLFGSEIAALDVTCTTQAEIDDHPVVLLTAVATTVDGMTRTVDAVIQVPRADYTAQVHSWTTG